MTPPSAETDDISPIVDRIVSLLLVRIVALVNTSDTAAAAAAAAACATTDTGSDGLSGSRGTGNSGGSEHRYSLVDYPDLSTTTIARTELDRAAEARAAANSAASASSATAPHAWPQPSITAEVVRQLREYVHRICSDYRAVHYHNVEHCYHVTLSASKLLDMMLCEQPQEEEEEEDMGEDDMGASTAVAAGVGTTEAFRERQQRRRRQQRDNNNADANGNGYNTKTNKQQQRKKNMKKRKLYGLRNDTLTHLAFVFSALIHDADHTGITNRRLVDEADELALLYNDQSVAEQRSLAVAFSTLLSPDFDRLRDVMFASREDYQRFRKVVIDLVLTTDIASPERTQIVKSKWKEAFPTAAQAARAEQREEQRRRSSMAASSAIHHRQHSIDGGGAAMMHSPPQIVERVGEEGEEGEESDETDLPEKEEGAQPSLLADLRKRADNDTVIGGNDADHGLRAGDTFTQPLKDCEGDTDEDEIGDHGRKMRMAAPPALRSSSRRKSSDCSSARVSIVDPLQAEQLPVLRRADSTSSVRSDGTSSLPGDETPQPQTLKSSFFRGRVSMGLGYLKGETDSVSARNMGMDGMAKEMANTRMSLTVQPGGQLLVPQSHRFSADSQEQSSSFHDDEEEDEISSDGDSVSTTTSSPSAIEEDSTGCGARGEDVHDDPHDGVIVSGVTLSKLDLEERDMFNQPASAGTGPGNFHHRAKSAGVTYENQTRIHPSIQRAMGDVNRGQGWKRAASDRKLLTSPAWGHSKLPPSLSKGSADGRQDLRTKMVRRFSLPNMSKAPKYELRLGIRRAVNLTGQPIETYAPRPAIKRIPSRDALDVLGDVDDESEEEEYDELKVSAILEHLIKAADVAALMQSFDNLNKWSSRLYREQKASAVVARGDDPEASWFEGQIVFMDIYIMPLARILAEPGIFDDETSKLFAQCVQDNRARWLIEGRLKTEILIANWNEKHTKSNR